MMTLSITKSQLKMLHDRAKVELTDGREPSFSGTMKKSYTETDVSVISGTAWVLGEREIGAKLDTEVAEQRKKRTGERSSAGLHDHGESMHMRRYMPSYFSTGHRVQVRSAE